MAHDQMTDPKTVASIKSMQGLILGAGGAITLFLSFATIFVIEDGATMAFSFMGIIAFGLIISWLISSVIERRMLGGKKLNYKITTAEKAAVFGATLFMAFIVGVNTGYGFIAAPLIIVFFN